MGDFAMKLLLLAAGLLAASPSLAEDYSFEKLAFYHGYLLVAQKLCTGLKFDDIALRQTTVMLADKLSPQRLEQEAGDGGVDFMRQVRTYKLRKVCAGVAETFPWLVRR
jgi:hypothetical protein